jgi:ubiquinone biosynthesis protein
LLQELGERLQDFATIDEKPLAAGSIAQVHGATLKDGSAVVLKVQRPQIETAIKADLSLMELLASLYEKYVPEKQLSIRPQATVAELTRALLGELDFIREGGNTGKIATNFRDDDSIVIPKVYWDYTSSRVLVLEKLNGIPVWDRDQIAQQGYQPKALVEKGLGMFLQMVFVDGEYHGDLHPGNLLVLSEGRLGVLDFGVTARISKSVREHLAALLVALVDEDFEMVSRHFAELSEPGAEFHFDDFQRDVHNAVAPFLGLRLKQVRSGRMLWDLAKIAAKHRAPMPPELIIFLKTLASFEGIGTHLDPDFDVIASCETFTHKIVQAMYSPNALRQQSMIIARDLSSLARYAPYQIKRILKDAVEGKFLLQFASDDVSKVAFAISQASSRLAVSLIIGSLIIGSSILVFAKVGTEYHNIPLIGLLGFSIAGLLGLYVIISILRGTRM